MAIETNFCNICGKTFNYNAEFYKRRGLSPQKKCSNCISLSKDNEGKNNIVEQIIHIGKVKLNIPIEYTENYKNVGFACQRFSIVGSDKKYINVYDHKKLGDVNIASVRIMRNTNNNTGKSYYYIVIDEVDEAMVLNREVELSIASKDCNSEREVLWSIQLGDITVCLY